MTDQDEITLGEVNRGVKRIEESIKELRHDFVTQNEFRPIARLVYGFTAMALLTVIGALIRLVVK